jgi:hypothetical protein
MLIVKTALFCGAEDLAMLSRFAGDGKAARASGVLTWNPEPRPDPSKSRD